MGSRRVALLPARLLACLAPLAALLLEGCDLGELVDSDEGSCHLLDSVTQVSGSPDACGREAFMMNGTQYLFMGSCSEQHESVLYKWDGANLQATQRFNTTDVRAIRHFEIGTTSYLAFTDSLQSSPIYWWNGVEFAEFQNLATTTASALVHFVIEGVPYLAVTQTPAASVTVYMWNGTAFEDVQEVSTLSQPRALAYFEVDGEKYLAIACHSDSGGLQVHRWNGASFVLYQEMEAFYAVDLAAMHIDGVFYLAVAEHTQGSRIYSKSGSDFQLFQRLGVDYTHGVHAFAAGGVQYLALATSSGRRNNVLAWSGSNFEWAFCVPGGKAFHWTSFGDAESPFLVLIRSAAAPEVFQIPDSA